jgi:hypothetical protein
MIKHFIRLCVIGFLMLALVSVAMAGQVTLTWTAPTYNEDGSALTDLAGYKIQYRNVSTTLWKYRTVADPSRTRLTIKLLPPGTYEFAMKSYNVVGVRSRQTGKVQATVL